MNDFLTFLSVALPIYTLIVYIIACSFLAKTAEDKGHESRGLGFACFFLGIPYMIWVASLPDLKARNYSRSVGTGLTSATQVPSSDYWECPSCHEKNAVFVGTCSCGTRKPSQYSGSNTKRLAEVPSGGWECPKCHARNANYVGTCSCGTRKPRK